MARLPRLSVAGMLHHVLWRGNNGQMVFLDDEDRTLFLTLVDTHARQQQVQWHGYVLMGNHVHLLLTPVQEGCLSRFMQAVGRAYVRRFNQRHNRFGTIWEGRYRSTVVDAETYLLPCLVYMDLNPVRAGLVHAPEQYAWSSHGHYTGYQPDKRLVPHPLMWRLGNTPFAREAAYKERVQQGLSVVLQQAITEAVLQGWPLGGKAFLEQLKEQTARRIEKRRPGRPVRAIAAPAERR